MALRKTPAGQAEVTSKAHALPPRARSLLIMIDGKRSLDDLRAMLGSQVDEAVKLLIDQGLVEGSVAAAPTPSPAPVSAPVPLAAAAVDVATLRRDAARAVTDALGPMADSLALRIEKTKSAEELQAALQLAAQVLVDAAPRAKAEAFRQRFLPG